MNEWLFKLFVKNRDHTEDQAVRGRYGTVGSLTGIVVNLLLSAMKFLVGTITGSVAVTADDDDVEDIYEISDRTADGREMDSLKDDIKEIVRNATTLR